MAITYDPTDDDSGLATFEGAVTVGYRWVLYDSSQALVGAGAWNAISFTLSHSAEIEVWDESPANIADGTGSFDFGETVIESELIQTFTIRNAGFALLSIDAESLSVPAGFSILSPPAETVAAYGETTDAKPTATETLTIPASVVPGFGGLHVEVASTAMVGLGEGARYLVEYPYGCAEQRGSRTLALVLASDLGDAFSLPGLDTKKMRPSAQQNLKELERFQCPNGGFSYWM